MTEILAMGIALAFNILIIMWKMSHDRTFDAILDGLLLAVVMWLTAGTLTGMLVGTVASAIVSLYLLIIRPTMKLPDSIDQEMFK